MAIRLAIVAPVFPPYHGGMGAVAAQHAQLFAARGYAVTVYTPWRPEGDTVGEPEQQSPDGYRIVRVAPNFSHGNAGRISLADAFENHDIVHLHYPFYFTAEQCIGLHRRHPQVRFFLTYHMDPVARGLKGLYFRFYARWIAPRIFAAAEKIFVSTHAYPLASSNAAYFSSHEAQLVEAPFGVNTTQFTPIDPTRKGAVRAALDLNPTLPMVLFVGGMDTPHVFKGVPVLLDAFAQVSASAQLVLVGDGGLRPSLQAHAQASGAKNPIRFVGAIAPEALSQYYQAADMVVVPSLTRAEAFGLVLLEAMASSVAAIASDLPGVASVLDHGRAGMLVPPGDARALCGAIDLLLQDADARRRYIDAGLTRIRTHYQWDRMVDAYESCYTSGS